MRLFISPAIEQLIDIALQEDLINNDMTSLFTVSDDSQSIAYIIAKEDMVFSGFPIVEPIIKKIDKTIKFESKVEEGSKIKKGTVCVTFEGNSRTILMAERIILNFMQRMSGISTKTLSFVEALNNPNIRIVDTRKTLPGFRAIDKYSVRMAKGYNHRLGLSDGIIIKENHIKATGSITKAIKSIKENVPHTMKVECEVTNLKEVKEAVDAEADIIMLDNMNIAMMQEAITIIRASKYKILIEVSGNVTIERLPSLGKLDIDIISTGAITHSIKAADLSMKFQ